jgi:UDP-N-acetylmuramate--alanine ligase
MNNTIDALYFIGAGGIGMSALIRYYLSKGKRVAGYDRAESELTRQLYKEGAEIHYEDDVTLIPDIYKNKEKTLVVYTPAVPNNHSELLYFRNNDFEIMKRSQILGEITRTNRGLCIAGTHGKTTTSSMVAHLFKQSHVDCNAFLGGILKNYNNNLLLSDKSDFTVIEADEYDRSFHQLMPYMAVITSVDPDHLDIYGAEEAYRDSFVHFTSLIKENGVLIIKKGLPIVPKLKEKVKVYTYSKDEEADFYARNIRIEDGEIFFDLVTPTENITGIQLGVPVKINIENAVAAMALAWLNGVTADELKKGMVSFKGVKRRFDFHLKTEKIVLIDDYAHHPEELKASINSVKELYPGHKLTTIFQPHLYTRTRDFYKEFAEALSLSDEVILIDIYPAREEPIPGVTSGLILDNIPDTKKQLCHKNELYQVMEKGNYDIVLMAGAGDIELLVEPVKNILSTRYD